MYLDAQAQFSDAQALTVTAASTNLIDLGGDHNFGIGEPMSIVIVVDVAADFTTTDETYVVDLQTDDNAGFASAASLGSATILGGSAAGSKFVIPVPADSRGERYIRLNYTLGGTSPTVSLTAFMIPSNMIQNEVVYPDGYTIS